MADAPHDIGGLRLWLDGMDVNGTDAGYGGGTSPANGAQVTQWIDKSGRGLNAGDATSFGANAHTYPTYSTTNLGVTFNGTSNVLEIPSGVYDVGVAVSDSEIFVTSSRAASTAGHVFYAGKATAGSSAINFSYTSTAINWDHAYKSTGEGRASVTWTASGSSYGTRYADHLYSSVSGASLYFYRNNAIKASASLPQAYTPTATDHFYIGGAEAGTSVFLGGTVNELIVFSRKLNTAERNIMRKFQGAKFGVFAGGAISNPSNLVYRYHVGGIGQEADGLVGTGTSAGLIITNTSFLAAGKYFMAYLQSLSPASGTGTAELPAGYSARSQRTWLTQVNGTAAGTVQIGFNLAQLGMSATPGQTLALVYRSAASGTMAVQATATYDGSGTVTFPGYVPQTGYVALAVAGGAPNITASLASTVIADGVQTDSFKAIPGSLIKASASVANSGAGSPDSNSTTLTLSIPPNSKFYLGDIAGAGGGPVQFVQGTTASGLNYTYTSLASTTDSLDFSNDSGTSWTYAPVADTQQGDAAITTIRVRPAGTFGTGTAPNYPSFTVNYGVLVN